MNIFLCDSSSSLSLFLFTDIVPCYFRRHDKGRHLGWLDCECTVALDSVLLAHSVKNEDNKGGIQFRKTNRNFVVPQRARFPRIGLNFDYTIDPREKSIVMEPDLLL